MQMYDKMMKGLFFGAPNELGFIVFSVDARVHTCTLGIVPTSYRTKTQFPLADAASGKTQKDKHIQWETT